MAQQKQDKCLISDGESLIGAKDRFDNPIKTYDDAFGPLWIHRDSMGVLGIVRAQTWETAYSICEDEFFPEADETIEELVKEYGFKRESRKVIKAPGQNLNAETRHAQLGAEEKFAEYPADYTDNGKLPQSMFIRWETIETPDPEAWPENDCFCEAFGFRPNGPNETDTLKHGIYAKDLNGDYLERLTPALLSELGITLEIETGDTE